MALVAVPAVLVVVLVALDVLRTVVLPSARGPLSQLVYRAVWQAARATPARIRPRTTQFAGPAGIGLSIASWLVLLWLAFALLYWPHVDDLAYSSDARFGGRGFMEALYLSGTALTTLGLGDVVGGTDALRLLTVLEAASGLGLFTATISYLPAIYTLVSQLRGSALAAADLRAGDPDGAAALAAYGGVSAVEALRRDVVATREHLLRFPVLFYFHPPIEESPLELARTAAGVCATLRWAADARAVAHAAHWGAVLEESLRRLLAELERQTGEHPARDLPATASPAAGRISAARAALTALDEPLAASGPVPAAAAELLDHVDEVLGAMAAIHGYAYRPVLEAAPSAAT